MSELSAIIIETIWMFIFIAVLYLGYGEKLKADNENLRLQIKIEIYKTIISNYNLEDDVKQLVYLYEKI